MTRTNKSSFIDKETFGDFSGEKILKPIGGVITSWAVPTENTSSDTTGSKFFRNIFF
jgi:hypothetical protein